MNIQISLFGFGDERPRVFGDADQLSITSPKNASLDQVLKEAGFKQPEAVTVMRNNQLVQKQAWSETAMQDGDSLTVLMAIEGG